MNGCSNSLLSDSLWSVDFRRKILYGKFSVYREEDRLEFVKETCIHMHIFDAIRIALLVDFQDPDKTASLMASMMV